METNPARTHDSTLSDPRTAVLEYLDGGKLGFIISPTADRQSVVLGGTRVDAQLAKSISLEAVGRAPIRATMGPEQ